MISLQGTRQEGGCTKYPDNRHVGAKGAGRKSTTRDQQSLMSHPLTRGGFSPDIGGEASWDHRIIAMLEDSLRQSCWGPGRAILPTVGKTPAGSVKHPPGMMGRGVAKNRLAFVAFRGKLTELEPLGCGTKSRSAKCDMLQNPRRWC